MISQEDVQKVADLARIELAQEELAHYQQELAATLDFFAQLDAVDVTQITDDAQGQLHNVYHDDTVHETPEDEKDLMIANMPEEQDRYTKVTSVL